MTIFSRLCIILFLAVFTLSATAQSTRRTTKKKQPATTKTISGLRSEREKVKQKIAAEEQKLRTNERNVKQRLQNLLIINNEITDKRKLIDSIRGDINKLDKEMAEMNRQLKVLQEELEDNKDKFVNSMRYMHRNRSVQNQLMFIFSAENFSQMYRRMRFMREYATFQRMQGEKVKAKQAEVTAKRDEIRQAKRQKNKLLARGETEQRNLKGRQVEQQKVVASLQRQQKTIQGILTQERKRSDELNDEIDRLVAIEVEKARKAAAEAARKEAAAAEERIRISEESMRKNKKLVADAKAHEERLRAEARNTEGKTASERAADEAAVREAEKARKDAERRAARDAENHEREIAEAKKRLESGMTTSADYKLSGSFTNNKGRLPMPVTGSYRIVNRFGQYNVEGLKNVKLDNKGINILGKPGAKVRCVFDGVVSAIFRLGGGVDGVIVRHGQYMTVYCPLTNIRVKKGQRVSTRQTLGNIGKDNILEFQLRKEKAKLNPEPWLGK